MEPTDAVTAEAVLNQAPSTSEPSRRRLTTFRVLAVIPGIFFLVAELHLLAPWSVILPMDEPRPEIHEWFYLVAACSDVFMLVGIAGLIVNPRLTALAAWVVAAGVIVLVTVAPLQPLFVIFVAALLLPAAVAYPYRGDLRAWRSSDSIASWGAVGGLAAIALGAFFGYGTWLDLNSRSAPTLPAQRDASGAARQT